MRLGPYAGDLGAPDACLERVLSARFIQLWYSIKPGNHVSKYDPAVVEEQYEKLHRDFIAQLPAVFAFQDPDARWDTKLPMLPRQRRMLHISVLVLLCHLLRPLLQLRPVEVHGMPQYKRNLVIAHRGYLVNAALSLLHNVAELHELMGGNQTRYFLVSFYTFEPAMLLGMHLLSIDQALELLHTARSSKQSSGLWNTTFNFETAKTMYADYSSIRLCREQIKKAVDRLQLLREVSVIGSMGYDALSEVHAKLGTAHQLQESNSSLDSSSDAQTLDASTESLSSPNIEDCQRRPSLSVDSLALSQVDPLTWTAASPFAQAREWDTESFPTIEKQISPWMSHSDDQSLKWMSGYTFDPSGEHLFPNGNPDTTIEGDLTQSSMALPSFPSPASGEEHQETFTSMHFGP